jgi:hypothetical protein
MIVIAAQDEVGLVQNAAYARGGVRPVANHVADADEGVVRVGQHGLESLEVTVHIGDDKDSHNFSPLLMVGVLNSV